LSGEEYDTKTGYMALAREDGPSALQKKKAQTCEFGVRIFVRIS
jgi:hypothetical protein